MCVWMPLHGRRTINIRTSVSEGILSAVCEAECGHHFVGVGRGPAYTAAGPWSHVVHDATEAPSGAAACGCLSCWAPVDAAHGAHFR